MIFVIPENADIDWPPQGSKILAGGTKYFLLPNLATGLPMAR
jgi:hypothetical protein